jgi:RNA recognition motif-containing protein
MRVRLFVGNLPYNATQEELKEHFSTVGPISYISLPTDRETGQPRGFAFIEFNDRAQAEEAIRKFNNQLFKGRPISVSEARERENRTPAGSSPRPSGGGFAPRPSAPRSGSGSNAEPEMPASSPPGGKRSRDFGPDLSPLSRRNKRNSGPKSERGPKKGPMRELVSGPFSSNEDDMDDLYDDVEDFIDDRKDDLSEEENESNDENLANRLRNPNSDNKT